MVNLGKDTDSQALLQECEDFGEVRAFKYIKQLDSAVVVFNDIRSAIDCKLVMQSKRPVSFGEVIPHTLALALILPLQILSGLD
jgi:hypothetical protein